MHFSHHPSPIYGYLKKPSMIDYRGELAAVFFLAGCNFRCGFCHNAPLLANAKTTLPWEKIESVCNAFQEDWVTAAVITGGEPTVSPALPELVSLLKGYGLKVKLDTNGSRPDVLEALLPKLDYIAMDVKCAPSKYADLTGFENTGNVLRSIELIRERAADYEFRTTIIPSFHTDDDMVELALLLRGSKRYVLQPFVPRVDLFSDRFLNEARTTDERMAQIRELVRGCAQEVEIFGSMVPAERN